MSMPFNEYPPALRQAMFDGAAVSPLLPYRYRKDFLEGFAASSSASISVSGAQQKMSLVVQEGILRYAEPGEQGTHILKPHPQRFALSRDIPANEEFCMRICRSVFRIPTAASALCFFQDGVPAYLTRRFDVLPDAGKLHMEDLASLSGLLVHGSSNAKYQGSYEELAEVIARCSSSPLLDLRLFFRMVLVNYLLCNGDAHAKNFSMLEDAEGAWRLAPAYDVMNTRVHVADADFAMENGLFRDKREAPRGGLKPFFLSWGETIGLNTRIASRDIDAILSCYPAILHELAASCMSRKAQSVFRYHLRQRFLPLTQDT